MPTSRKIMGVSRGIAGALTAAGTISTGASSNPTSVCISADGKNVYTANYGNNTVSIFTRNTSTGALSGTSTIATGTSPQSVCISSDGKNVYVANNASNTVSIYNRS